MVPNVRRKCLDSAWWQAFYIMHGLKLGRFLGLLAVDPDQITFDDQYWEVLAICRHENPVTRTETSWCGYVDGMTTITAPNLIALFHATCIGSVVTGKMSSSMLFALAHMCGRLKVPTRFPDLWDQVAPCGYLYQEPVVSQRN